MDPHRLTTLRVSSAASGGNPTVLLADGHATRQRSAAAALLQAGYRVVAASTGAEAILCWRSANPDVVVLDADLGQDHSTPTGIEVLRTLCRSKQPEPMVITTSADTSVERVLECLNTGARDHLRVPFDRRELVARVGAAARVADEAERLRRRNRELAYLGGLDDLTSLASRREIEDELRRLGAAAARHHHPLAAVMLSVDHWSDLEAAGGVVTNAVLQEVAVLIAAIGRTGDLAGRYADHEFLVVLPMTGGEGGRAFAERVRSVVAAAPIQTEEGSVAVSLSAGCATDAPGPEELLSRAQLALARAEAAGGNTLVCMA